MFNLGAPEMLMILLVALLVFGPQRIPELARTIGRAMRELQRATSEMRHTVHDTLEDIENARPQIPNLKEIVGRMDTEPSPTRAAFAGPPPGMPAPVVASTPTAADAPTPIGGTPQPPADTEDKSA